MSVVRAYGDALGSGIMRTHIDDFDVTELYDFEPSNEGEHLLLWVEKRGANTGWVANQFADYFGLRHFDVSYCGKKDRHAVTRQWFSCWLPHKPDLDLANCKIEGVEIVGHQWHQKKLRRGEHTGNQFRIVLRDVTADSTEIVARLEAIAVSGVPNYFGRQRFGRDGQNLVRARELIADKDAQSRRKLDRKQKDIYVSALRSMLFNYALSQQVNAQTWCDEADLWVYGLSPHRDITIPAVDDVHEDAAAFIETIGIKAHARAKRLMPASLNWQFEADTLTLDFSLPVGAYATTMLEEILNIEDAQQ